MKKTKNIWFKQLNITNTLNNITDMQQLTLSQYDTLIDLLCVIYPDGFEYETEVYINQKLINIDDYDTELSDNDLVVVSNIPQGNFIIMLVVNILISVILSYLFKPKNPESRQSSSVYSTQQNQIEARPNEVIPVQYGRMRQYPKLISPAYKMYINNKQYHVLHTLLGISDYDIHNIYINETNINTLSNLVQYKVTGVGTKANHISDCITTFANPDIAYIVHSPEELNGITHENINNITQYIAINPSYTLINKAIVNFNFGSGLYYNDEGSINSFTVNVRIKFIEIDDEDNELTYTRTFTHSMTNNRTGAYRNTFVATLKQGRYKVNIERLTANPSEAASSYTIEAIHGFDIEQPSFLTNDYTFISFFVEVGESIASNSGVKLNVDCSRKNNGNVSYKTLYDFVIDIWTNESYGMNEDLIYLDIRAELNEQISLIIDKSENAFDHLTSVLKSFGYQIYPYLNKFVISKQATQPFRTLLFNHSNCRDITFSYNLKSANEILKGVKVRYIREGEINFDTLQYPSEQAISYEESVLPGVCTEAQAFKAAVFMYNKNKYLLKTAQITTDFEGLVPELHSRIGIATEYLDNTFTVAIKNIVGNVITLNQPIHIKANKTYYAIIESISNVSSNMFMLEVETADIYTDILYANETLSSLNEDSYVIIGDRTTIIEDYTIESIQPSSMSNDITKPIEVKLICQEYNPTIYQETT